LNSISNNLISKISYPRFRARRLRQTAQLRALVRETALVADHLVMPLFVCDERKAKRPIRSMPGQYQFGIEPLMKKAEGLQKSGISSVILFGIPKKKDESASAAYSTSGIIPKAVKALKRRFPDLIVITDVCLCEYTSHGHCGVIQKTCHGSKIDNDRSLKLLAKASLAYAEAGCDMIAPSDMMDGRVGVIRSSLDSAGFVDLPIMSYAAKFASSFYSPFREAAGSPPKFGDRRSYQMDYSNGEEAMREAAIDINEGADIVMVKPALGYQDLIWRIKHTFGYPVAAYNVSGEYAMVKAAAQQGWVDERQAVMEMLICLRRSGADIILTYWAQDAANWLKSS